VAATFKLFKLKLTESKKKINAMEIKQQSQGFRKMRRVAGKIEDPEKIKDV